MRTTTTLARGVITSLLLSVLLAGCANFHTLYFVREDRSETMIDRYRVTPRIFAYQDMQTSSKTAHYQPFSVTVRVEDTGSDRELESWRVGQDVINAVSDGFLARAREVFMTDSIVLHQEDSDNPPRVLTPDPDNFSPRRESYFTLRFGEVDLPRKTLTLRAVLHYHVADADDAGAADSVVWIHDRVIESRQGIKLGANTVRGYD